MPKAKQINSTKINSTENIFLGIDGGGTKCCALLVDANGAELGRGIGGSANAYQNLLQTQNSIITATHMALRAANLPDAALKNIVAGVGLAGVNVPSVFTAMNAWQHPFKTLHLSTDLHIACLGAHQSDGAVIVAGTGSCGYAFVNNQATIIGGHGFLLGDKGSAAWIGLAAVKAVLLAADNLASPTDLSELLSDYLQAKNIALVEKLSNASSADFAQLARFVFIAADKKDETATKILCEGADYLSALAELLWQTKPPRMAMLGGVAQAIQPWLTPNVLARLSAPLQQPEFGAVCFARQKESA
jgi:glucosamine kinase